MAIARISQVAVEVLTKEVSSARVSQVAVEALTKDPSSARISQVAVEVLFSTKARHYATGDLVAQQAQITGLASITEPPPLNTISFMFLL